MVDPHTTFGEDFLKVAIGYPLANVEEDGEQDHVLREMQTFEGNSQCSSRGHRKIDDASIPPHRFMKSLPQNHDHLAPLSLDGEVLDSKLASGMDAPKDMALMDRRIYVANLTHVRITDG